jgi:hypothetical protein
MVEIVDPESDYPARQRVYKLRKKFGQAQLFALRRKVKK